MKKVFFIILLLCLALPVFAGFKSPTTPNQPLIVESDKYFYGSDRGVVDIDLNLINPNSVDYDLFLNITDLYDYGVRISRFKDNGKDVVIDSRKLKTKNKLNIKKNSVSRIQISLNYDLQIIGFGKKFDVQLVNDLGLMIADLDPFLSGWTYRKPLTITTPADQNGYKYSQINLITDTNALINASKLKNDCNDLRITYGETTPIDINVSGCATTTTSIKFVLQQKINANTNNTDYYLYYGNLTATKYPNADKNWQTMYDDFSVDSIGTDWNALGTWEISGGYATSTGGGGKYMIYNYREYELPTDSVELVYTLSDKGSISNGNSKWQFFADYSNANACGAFGFNNAYMDRFAQSADSVGNIIKMAGGGYNDLASADSSAWTNLILKVSGTTISADWTGGVGNPNTVNDDTFRGIKKIGFGDHDCANMSWGKIDANYIHNTSVSIGSEETEAPTWHNFWIRPYTNPALTLDLNIKTDMNFYLDFNLTLNNFNVNDINTFYTVSYGPDDTNCFIGIRNTRLCGWKKEIWAFTKIGGSGDIYTMRSGGEDDHAYKPSSYNLDPDDYDTKGGVITLNSGNTWANTLITGARYDQAVGDSNMFFNLSWSGNFTGGINRNLILYDCNSTTTTPSTNAGCVSRIYTNTTQKDADTYYSFLYETNDTNSFSGMKLNSDGNHWLYFNCPKCTPTQYWTLDYIAQNSNVDRVRNWTSTTGIVNLATYTNTIDAHIHWQSLLKDSNFYYYFAVKDATTDYNSPVQTEDVDNVNLSPLIELITSPVGNQVYSNDVNFTLKVGDPNSDAIVCDANIRNAKTGVDYNIFTNWPPVNNLCTIQKSTLAIPDGNYYLIGRVRETGTTELYSSSREMDQNFFIDNNAPIVVLNSPNGGATYTQPTTVNIDFNLTDYYSPLLLDINYSVSGAEGTGTVIESNLSTNSVKVLCTSSIFETTQNCVYSWSVTGISDGNYKILIKARDDLNSGFDASDNNFEIKEPVLVPSTPPRYINPEYDQRDSNIYYSLKQDYAKTDTEKTNEILINMQNNIFLLFGIIIIIGVVLFIWTKK